MRSPSLFSRPASRRAAIVHKTRSRMRIAASVAVAGIVASTAAVAAAGVGEADRTPARAQHAGVATVEASRASAAAPAPISDPADKRPNIILISSDDQRLSEMAFLPKTRELLGDAGLTYENALTPHPLCCPARAEILTGQFAQNNGVRTNFLPQGSYRAYDETNNIGMWLNSAGYNTAFLGKHINNYNSKYGRDPGWTIFNPTSGGYSDYYDFGQYNDGKPIEVPGYYTDYLNQTAVEYAKKLSDYQAPFFMWVSHFAPHSTQGGGCDKGGGKCKTAPKLSPRYEAAYRSTGQRPSESAAMEEYQRVLRSPAFNEADVSDKQNEFSTHDFVDREYLRELILGRAGALASVDDAVAALVEQLADDGELANTYLVFITDNGYLLGEHRFVGKVMPYEESVRTPMLVRGPGIAPGRTTEKVATLVDLAPTFVDIAGARSTVLMDGTSLLPMWRGDSSYDPHASGVLIQAGAYKGQTADRGWYYRGIRTDRYTYVKYFDGHIELYDRLRDPHQVSSVAGQKAYRAIEARLARRTADLKKCAGPAECNQSYTPVPEPKF